MGGGVDVGGQAVGEHSYAMDEAQAVCADGEAQFEFPRLKGRADGLSLCGDGKVVPRRFHLVVLNDEMAIDCIGGKNVEGKPEVVSVFGPGIPINVKRDAEIAAEKMGILRGGGRHGKELEALVGSGFNIIIERVPIEVVAKSRCQTPVRGNLPLDQKRNLERESATALVWGTGVVCEEECRTCLQTKSEIESLIVGGIGAGTGSRGIGLRVDIGGEHKKCDNDG